MGNIILHVCLYYFEEERLLRQTKLIMILVIGSVKCERKLLTKQRVSGFVSYFPDVHTITNDLTIESPENISKKGEHSYFVSIKSTKGLQSSFVPLKQQAMQSFYYWHFIVRALHR